MAFSTKWNEGRYQSRILHACVGILFATLLAAQKETFVPANDVSFSITIAPNHYPVGERIQVTYRILNISKGALHVPRAWEAKCPSGPHVWAWFENSAGKHFMPGYAGSCMSNPQTVSERMTKEAVLLKPGERLEGSLQLDTTLFSGLPPGAYRVEAVLYGWNDKDFTDAERLALSKIGNPFLRGEIPASARITLTPKN